MDIRNYEHEVRTLFAIAKANGDADTGLKLLMMLVAIEEPMKKDFEIPRSVKSIIDRES